METTMYLGPIEKLKIQGHLSINGITVRLIGEKIYAYQSWCPHKAYNDNLALAEFIPEEESIECPFHQFRFCLISGENKRYDRNLKFGRIKVYQTFIEDNNLYLKIIENEKINLQNCR